MQKGETKIVSEKEQKLPLRIKEKSEQDFNTDPSYLGRLSRVQIQDYEQLLHTIEYFFNCLEDLQPDTLWENFGFKVTDKRCTILDLKNYLLEVDLLIYTIEDGGIKDPWMKMYYQNCRAMESRHQPERVEIKIEPYKDRVGDEDDATNDQFDIYTSRLHDSTDMAIAMIGPKLMKLGMDSKIFSFED